MILIFIVTAVFFDIKYGKIGLVMKMRDKYEGCLAGLAVGDTMGMPTELLSRDEIKSIYGRTCGMVDAAGGGNIGLKRGSYTDDTQMTMALAKAINKAGYVEQYTVADEFMKLDGRLIGGGAGCMEGIANMKRGIPWDKAGSSSAGNGAAMRTAPVALFYHGDASRILRAVRVHSIMTHKDSRAVEAAQMTSLAIDYLLDGKDPADLLDYLISFAINSEIKDVLEETSSLAQSSGDGEIALNKFDISGYSVGSLGAALYIFIKHADSYRDTVLTAANMGGDSDTIAAIAGAFSGAYNGIVGIPEDWIKTLKDEEIIIGLADELYDLSLNPYKPVPDVLDYNLKAIFVGYNPGLASAERGHFYASNTNRFWKVLNESGILPRPLTWKDDWRMVGYGYGLTDIVKQCTREAKDITDDMYKKGKKRLIRVLNQYHPGIICYNGKGIYQKLMGLKKIDYGVQPTHAVPGIMDYVVPSTSGRTGIKWSVRLGYFAELNNMIN